jgi:RNA polymerase sigma factor (sigma-70 family)
MSESVSSPPPELDVVSENPSTGISDNSLEDSSDTQLLNQITQQNQQALSTLYDRYHRLVYTIAQRSLNSPEDSEEIVIDVFSQVWRSADRYKPDRARVDTWILMMARSRILDRLRSKQRHGKSTTACMEVAQENPLQTAPTDPAEDVILRERRTTVLTALVQLPEQQRQVLEMAYYQGLSQSEIVAQTGMALGTVKTRMRLGLNKLRGLLGDLE